MTPDGERADRDREVREAARGWHRSGALDDRGLAEVTRLFPDDRARLGPAFRALVFVFAALALVALWLFIVAITGWSSGFAGVSALVYGVGLAVLTDVQIGALRRDQAGAEAATGLLSVGFLLGGIAWLLDEPMGMSGRSFVVVLLGIAVSLCAAGAIRWGSNVHAALAVLSFYGLFLNFVSARALWAAAALVLAPLALRGSSAAGLAPRHRRSCEVVMALSVVALYTAVHIGSWDSRLLEGFAGGWPEEPRSSPLRVPFVAGTAVLPVTLIVLGIARRRLLLIRLGVALGVASLVTIRFYVHVAPLWVVLTGGGVAALAFALGLRRFLASGPGGERFGFTAEPLFDDPEKRHALEAAASIVAATPAATPAPTAAGSSFSGGGGQSGGGGASDRF
jgi:hypothetical protein